MIHILNGSEIMFETGSGRKRDGRNAARQSAI